jgi:hypothetical protein
MSSTRKTSEYPSPAYNLPTGEEAAEAVVEVAEAALGFGWAVEAAAVEAAAVEAAGGGLPLPQHCG